MLCGGVNHTGRRARTAEEQTHSGSGSDYSRFLPRLQADFATGAAKLRAGVPRTGTVSLTGSGPARGRFLRGRARAAGLARTRHRAPPAPRGPSRPPLPIPAAKSHTPPYVF